MRIAIVTNPNIEEFIEDKWIAEAFKHDGHEVVFLDKYYPEKYDAEFDIFLKRNCWGVNEKEFELGKSGDAFKTRLINKNKLRINCDGKFDGSGKMYLCNLYKIKEQVVPSVATFNEIDILPKSKTYLLKPHNGWDGFGIKKVSKTEAQKFWNKNYIIQPEIEFESEVQFYFVGNKFEYALEFKPSKVPIYPEPKTYNFAKSELELAKHFANLSPNYNGVQRIDFLKTKNNLLLLEIEDSSPYLDLESVSVKKRTQFIKDYKNLVYSYIQKSKK